MRLAYLLFAVILATSPLVVFAQTSTPTPTPFSVPATPTKVPNGNPTGLNGAWQVCTLYQLGTAWACKYLNNGRFSVGSFAIATGSGNTMIDDQYHLVIVPPSVVSADLYCVYGYQQGRSHTSATMSGGTQSVGGSDLNRTGGWGPSSQANSYTIYHAHQGTTTAAINAWAAYVKDLPINDAARNLGWGMRTNSSATGWTGVSGVPQTAYAMSVIECQVLYYSTTVGGLPQQWQDEYPPTPTPIPTITLTPTPIGWGGTAQPWPNAIPWSTPIAVPVTIGVSPGTRVCNTIIPTFTFGPYSIFGYDLGASWSAVQVCNSEFSFSWTIFGVDFGAYLTVIVAIGAIGLLYSRLR